jgi:carboxyl-terminal processing protease
MSVLDVVLLVVTALALWIPLLRRLSGRLPRWLDFVPTALVALMLIQIVADGFHAYMIVTYGVVVLLFLFTFRRLIRPDLPIKASRLRSVLAFVGVLLGIVVLIGGIWVAPMAAIAAGEDLSRASWTTAFEGMNRILAERYAFTEWKQMDWDALYAEYAPRIAAAEEVNDQEAYYLALREYFFSIPDGHVIHSGEDGGLWRASIRGGYGLALIELDDGAVIAHVLQAGGPAEQAGMAWGAEILEWGGMPTREAIGAVSPIWVVRPPATQEGRRFFQQSLLTRAPVGTEIPITFQNPGQDEPQTVTLTAVDDGLEPLYEASGWSASAAIREGMSEEVDTSVTFKPPEWKILPEGYGYIQVYHLRPREGDPDFVGIVDQAMAEFVAQDVPGIIIDVRGNPGGHDELVPAMMGYFFTEPDLYEYQYFDNWPSGLSFFDLAMVIGIEPKEPHYGGPVAVLIDANTVSSGEGFPLLAKRLPQGHVVGVYGTHGSFGMCCGTIHLPGDSELLYSVGQSHDANHHVQVEGDHNLQGGVVPDIRVPLTRETVYAMFVEGEDVVLQRAVESLQGP